MRTEEQVLIAMFEALIPWYEAHKRELPWRQFPFPKYCAPKILAADAAPKIAKLYTKIN